MDITGEITSIRQAIDSMAEMRPMSLFLTSAETGEAISFQDLKLNSISLSRMLGRKGLEPGDKVAFLMDNGLAAAQIFLGAMYGGYVAVPLNVRAGAVQLTYMLDHCDAKVVYVAPQYSDLLHESLGGVRTSIQVIETTDDGPLPALDVGGEETLPLPASDDVALLMYSSGSTGKPKAAIHTHQSILAHGRNSIEAHQLTSKDKSLLVLPLYHINAECVTLVPTLLSGGSVVVAHRFTVGKFWKWIDEFRVTWSALVPTIISELVDWNDSEVDRYAAAFEHIRFFRSSSAPLAPSLHRQFLDKYKLPLIQAMGSTEAGNVFSNPVPPGVNKIGSPGLSWGFEARIVDRQGADVPPGESGEVLLRGPALMRGYYKDLEGTAAVVDSEGWLHTGDLARQDEDGYFFVVGRSKELIIKGGVNIAPRQIDEVLESHPAVLEAAAVGVPDRYFGEDAIAFVVLRSEATAEEKELLAFCESRLGHFKTPSRIHFLKELPKGPSGKVQRLRLLDPAVLAAVAATAQPESRTLTINGGAQGKDGQLGGSSIEQIIAAAWSQVLGVPQVDPQTNFFALGGHSLLAIQCLSKFRDRLPIVLSLADFFEFSTVAEQARVVRERLLKSNGAKAQADAGESGNWEQSLLQQYVAPPSEEIIPRQDPSLPYLLSPAQQGLWFLEKLNPDVPVYNEAEAVRLTGELNVEALEMAMNMVIDRQDVLRSTIKVIDEAPYAVVHKSWPLRFKKIDLGALPADEREAEIERLLIAEPRVPYRLEEEPGVRVTLLHLGPHEHVLILMMHHIICDWASEGVIWRDLSAIYRSLLTEQSLTLPELTVRHGDYAVWRQQKVDSNTFADDLSYWEETLKGAPALLELPADRPRPPVMSYRGDRIRWKLDNTLTEALRKISRTEKASMFTIFAAALDTLLYRYTGNEDILVGTPIADRDYPGLQSLIGYLLRVHVLRTRLQGEMTFRDLLRQVQKTALDLYLHRAIPFDRVVQRIQPERNLGYTPVFQVMLNWRDRDQMLPFIGLEGLAIDSLMAAAATSKFDVLLLATDLGDEVWLELEYNTDIFDRERMTRMLGHYQTLLDSLARDPAMSLTELPMMPVAERQQVVLGWNDTVAAFPAEKCVHQLFEEQAAKTPNAPAVTFETETLTYAELNSRANRLAHYLRTLGVQPDARVGICAERSLEMVIALLAVLKAGGAYVPLDPAYPSERLRFILRDSGSAVVLTRGDTRKLFEGFAVVSEIIDLGNGQAWEDQPTTNPNPAAARLNARNLAYIIYTSGSTGVPKGVAIEHRNAVNFVGWARATFTSDELRRTLFSTSLNFDLSVFEMFAPISTGGTVMLVRDAMELTRRKLDVTLINTVPSAMTALLESGAVPASVCAINLAGEPLKRVLAERIFAETNVAKVSNLYGPSETTTYSTGVTMLRSEGFAAHIGKPIANTRVYILDGRGEPVPVGVTGELYIGGEGVARGYLNRPDLTAERFVVDRFCREPGARMYRTGDLARYLPDGNIEFLGRNDFQVKLRGFRIELGEIEAALEEQPGIRNCVVVLENSDSADQHLVAYIVQDNTQVAPTFEAMTNALKQRLPVYMIPAVFSSIDELPLTSNGKVDRRALVSLKSNSITRETTIDNPRDSIEERLLRIWEQLIEARPIGIRSSFFDLGGHSLLAIKLFEQTNKEFCHSLPIATIIRSPTIEQLATCIRGHALGEAQPLRTASDATQSYTSIFPLHPTGSAEPVFIIAGRGQAAVSFYKLSEMTGTEHPFFGIEVMLPTEHALLRLEDLAGYYRSEIQKQQSKGPYYLLGYSLGGTIAFEIAQQLYAVGETVEMLGMLDTSRRDYVVGIEREHASYKLNRRAARHIHNLRTLSPMGMVKYLWEKLEFRTVNSFYRAAATVGFRTVPSFLRSTSYILRVAELKYKPRAWPGSIILFRAAERGISDLAPDLGWGSIALGGVELRELPCDHFSLFREPHIQILAASLRERLQRADREATKAETGAYSLQKD